MQCFAACRHRIWRAWTNEVLDAREVEKTQSFRDVMSNYSTPSLAFIIEQ